MSPWFSENWFQLVSVIILGLQVVVLGLTIFSMNSTAKKERTFRVYERMLSKEMSQARRDVLEFFELIKNRCVPDTKKTIAKKSVLGLQGGSYLFSRMLSMGIISDGRELAEANDRDLFAMEVIHALHYSDQPTVLSNRKDGVELLVGYFSEVAVLYNSGGINKKLTRLLFRDRFVGFMEEEDFLHVCRMFLKAPHTPRNNWVRELLSFYKPF